MADPRFLLDTNICIYLLGGGSDAARDRVQAFEPGEVVTSSIAFAEVMIGALKLDAVAEAEAMFEQVSILPFGESAARVYGRLPFRRGSFDRLIAAHALALGTVLVTNNERDFVDIPQLKIENWMVS